MKDEILSNLDNPGYLEKLYRTDKPTFKRTFQSLYPELKENTLAGFWNERLNFTSEEVSWGNSKDLFFVIVVSLLAGIFAKTPVLLNVTEDFFYPRNIGFIVFPALSAYFAWKNKISVGRITFITCAVLLSLVFINLLPDVQNSDTLILSCIHLPLFLWAVLGFAFAGKKVKDVENRLAYLRYNGDLIVMTALILLASGIMTGVTIGLFNLIGFDIRKYYFEYVAVFWLSAVPLVATYLTQQIRSWSEKFPGDSQDIQSFGVGNADDLYCGNGLLGQRSLQ